MEKKEQTRTRTRDSTGDDINDMNLVEFLPASMNGYVRPANEPDPTRLFEACSKGLDSEVKNLLEGTTGYHVNQLNSMGEVAIQHAARNGHLTVVKVLVGYGASPNVSPCTYGQQPLLEAARGGFMDVVLYLIECGANISAIDDKGANALNYAARSGNAELVRHLIKLGVDINNMNDGGVTPLHDAVQTCSLECTKILVESGAEITTQKRDAWKPTVLNFACGAGSLEIVNYLLETVRGRTKAIPLITGDCLEMACFSGKLELVKLFGRTSVPRKTVTIGMTTASQEGHLAILEWLFKQYGFPSSKRARTVILHDAVDHNYPEIVNFLLDNGMDTDLVDAYGDTALHRACLKGRQKHVELLVEKGYDPNKRNINGVTPFHNACECGEIEIVRYLIANQAHVNEADSIGRTPLKFACLAGSPEIVDLLVKNGAKPDSIHPENTDLEFPCGISVWAMYALSDPKPYLRIFLGAGYFPNTRTVASWILIDGLETFQTKLLPHMKSVFMELHVVPELSLLLAAREKNLDSPFHRDYLPKDIFKELYFLVRKSCKEHAWDLFLSREQE